VLSSNNGGNNYAVAGYSSAQILTSVKYYTNTHKSDLNTLFIIWSGMIIGLFDLSQTPLATFPHNNKPLLLGLYPTTNDKMALHNMCTDWNTMLFVDSKKRFLKKFKESHNDADIYIWNPNSLLKNIIEHPDKYSLPKRLIFNTVDSHINDANYLASQITYCGNTAHHADKNSRHYMFYNFIHPTSYIYHIIEQHMMYDAVLL
jgi:hypothetical protein